MIIDRKDRAAASSSDLLHFCLDIEKTALWTGLFEQNTNTRMLREASVGKKSDGLQ